MKIDVQEKPDTKELSAAPKRSNVNPPVPISPAAKAVWAEIQRLGLEKYVAELDVMGLTVVPPEIAAPAGFCDRVRDKVKEVSARRIRHFGENEDNDPVLASAFGELLPYILFEDPIFQEALLNPVALAFADYLVGTNAIVYNCSGAVKKRGETELGLHWDGAGQLPPFQPSAQVINVTYALTEYNKENGGVLFVPGSHKYYRPPIGDEGYDQRVAVEAKAGSLVIWNGYTWHGAFPRTAPGERVNLICAMCRPHLMAQEAFCENVTPEILAANPPRFARLMGQHRNYGWKEAGPQVTETKGFNFGRHPYD